MRAAIVEEITLRLDKGFFAKEMVQTLEALGVRYVLKVPDQAYVRFAFQLEIMQSQMVNPSNAKSRAVFLNGRF